MSFIIEAWPQIGQVGLAAMFDQHPDWEAQASAKYREAAEAGRSVSGPRVWQIMDRCGGCAPRAPRCSSTST